MKARKPSSSGARHCRLSHVGGAKLAYRRGTIASTTTSNRTWTTGCLTNNPIEIAKRRTATSPPNPRLRERSLQACTAGRFRATSQKRTIGSPTHAHQIKTHTTATIVLAVLPTDRACAAMRKTLAAAHDEIATAWQRRGRGMILFR